MKLGNYENILTGKTESLSLQSVWQKVVGVIVLLGVVAVGQKLAGTIQSRTGNKLDLSPTSLFETPVSNEPNYIIY